MVNTLITATYNSEVGPYGALGDALTALNNIPIDVTLLKIWGLMPITDTPSRAGSALHRVIVTQMTPTIADAAGTANLLSGAGAQGSVLLGLAGITVTNQGGLYYAPPVVTFNGGNPNAVVNPATGLVAQPQNAQAFAQMQVRGCLALLGGVNYTGATVCSFVGPLAPGGVAATGTVTVMANAVTAIVMTNNGGPYLEAPRVVITDPGGGTGAEVVAGLSVSGVFVTYGGIGYQAAPNAVFTPLFKQQVPDAAGNPAQAATLRGWMTGILQTGINSPWQELLAVT